MITRKLYLDKISDFIDIDIIKVITGVRRCGKSTLLKQLLKKINNKNSIYLNFEEFDNQKLLDVNSLNTFLESKLTNNNKWYLLLDEIQLVLNWEKAINSIKTKHNVDIYLTGSNAQLLSGELATLISGRYVQIEIFPFSYSEYKEIKPKNSFNEYLIDGGMPMISDFNLNADGKRLILQDIYNSIILKDITMRNKVRNIDLLERIIVYVMQEVGKVFSANSISKYFKNDKRIVSPETILNYLHLCENAYLIKKIGFTDITGKKNLLVNQKYYLIDHGIREVVVGGNSKNIELILENIIYIELLRRGYKVSVGKIKDFEIDFIAQRNNIVEYYQVSYLLESEKTRQREFGNLNKIPNNYSKFVLSMDKQIDFSQNGIKHFNIEEWLLN